MKRKNSAISEPVFNPKDVYLPSVESMGMEGPNKFPLPSIQFDWNFCPSQPSVII